jgi:vancomycin resistance protein YoaR
MQNPAIHPSPTRVSASFSDILRQAFLAVGLGGLFFGGSLLVFFFVYQIWFAGLIFPGVSIAGLDVGGLTTAQAAAKVATTLTYPSTGTIILQDGTQTWEVTPAEIGLFLDPNQSALEAYNIGRSGTFGRQLAEQISGMYYSRSIAPVLIFDERAAYAYLYSLSEQIDSTAVEATINLEGTEVSVTPGHSGRALDVYAALELIDTQLRTLQDGSIDLPITTINPVVMDASAAAEIVRQVLSEPLSLTLPEGQPDQLGPWQFDPATLAGMLSFERVQDGNQGEYRVAIDRVALNTYLNDLAPSLTLDPADARFIFNDDTRQLDVIRHAVIGRSLDVAASITAIQEGVAAGLHSIPLVFNFTNPEITDDVTAEELGITELIYAETSYFRGSTAARIQNITIASSQFHGLLIPPGATFSMGQAMGDISLDNGYAEALIIDGDRTIRGVGGGVCQVSSTLFRTAFYAGFPILERHAHSYRVGYYEQTATGHDSNLAGMDATVFFPLVDLVFVNDTPYWLLMETYINTSNYSLTWKFYSSSDGRTVDWTTTGPVNVVEAPDDIYNLNPDLAQGEIVQVDYAAEGAEVTVNRTVYRNGSVYFSDSYFTHYSAWANVYEFGPGTDVPYQSNPSE